MSDSLLVPVILSGGSGTRLWPVSREKHPTQLQPLLGDESLLQNTLRRLEGLPLAAPIIVSNQEYRFITAEQLGQLGLARWTLLLEPVGRNTAPALTAAAFYATRDGADPVLLATPADHHIRNVAAFRDAVLSGLPEADRGSVVTFGIIPDRAETGYGYIEARAGGDKSAVWDLLAFAEKPDVAKAQAYVAGGRHFWNSGIFMLRASVWLKAIGRFAPEILAACRKAVDGAKDDGDFVRLDAEAFAASPADSIDYAVMEKLPSATELGISSRVVPLDVGWSDVGAWDALWQAIDRDADGNAVKGDVWLEDSHGNLVIAERGLVACIARCTGRGAGTMASTAAKGFRSSASSFAPALLFRCKCIITGPNTGWWCAARPRSHAVKRLFCSARMNRRTSPWASSIDWKTRARYRSRSSRCSRVVTLGRTTSCALKTTTDEN